MSPDSSNPPVPPISHADLVDSVDSGTSVADLKLVDEPGQTEDRADEEAIQTDPADTVTDESTFRSLPIWIFLVGLVLAVVVISWQAQRAGQLEAEITGLEGKLERSNALVEAHRSHLGEIRGGVYDLSERLDGLRALVDGGPGAGVPDSAPQTPPAL